MRRNLWLTLIAALISQHLSAAANVRNTKPASAAPVVQPGTTWKGLRFGMTEPEIRKAYAGTLRKETVECQACKDHKQTTFVDEFKLFGERVDSPLNVRAKATLVLSDDGKLECINITVEKPFADKEGTDATGSSLAVINEVMNRLKDKYGSSTAEEGTCQADMYGTVGDRIMNNQPAYCSKTWRVEGQNIALVWSIENKRLENLIVSYKPFNLDSAF